MKVKILGNLAGLMGKSRQTSAHALIGEKEWMLFDAGPMIIDAIEQAELKLSKLSTIYISHSHADHLAGVITLVTQLSLRREKAVYIHASEKICAWIAIYLQMADIDSNQFIFEAFESKPNFSNTFGSFKTYSLGHSVACEFTSAAKFTLDSKKLHADNVPVHLWKTFKNHQESGYVLWQPEQKIAFIFDVTMQQLQQYVPEAQLDFCLIECTFLSGQKMQANERQHLTTDEVNQFFQKYQPKQLVVTHFSRKNTIESYRQELNSNIEVAEIMQEWQL